MCVAAEFDGRRRRMEDFPSATREYRRRERVDEVVGADTEGRYLLEGVFGVVCRTRTDERLRNLQIRVELFGELTSAGFRESDGSRIRISVRLILIGSGRACCPLPLGDTTEETFSICGRLRFLIVCHGTRSRNHLVGSSDSGCPSSTRL